MARIIYSSLVNNIAGSIGGTTFQTNSYGYTVKQKPNMIKPKTTRQRVQQQAMSKAIKRWQNLSSDNRDIWNSWAAANPQYSKHNSSSVLTGYAVAIKWWTLWEFLNKNESGFSADVPVITTPASSPTNLPTVSNIKVYRNAYDDTGQYIISVENTDSAGQDIFYPVYSTPPIRLTNNDNRSKAKLIGYQSEFNNLGVYRSQYVNVFGQMPSVGDYVQIFVKISAQLNGLISSEYSQICEVEYYES